jgi:hypothetical protein
MHLLAKTMRELAKIIRGLAPNHERTGMIMRTRKKFDLGYRYSLAVVFYLGRETLRESTDEEV